jgi:hypothetical protein
MTACVSSFAACRFHQELELLFLTATPVLTHLRKTAEQEAWRGTEDMLCVASADSDHSDLGNNGTQVPHALQGSATPHRRSCARHCCSNGGGVGGGSSSACNDDIDRCMGGLGMCETCATYARAAASRAVRERPATTATCSCSAIGSVAVRRAAAALMHGGGSGVRGGAFDRSRRDAYLLLNDPGDMWRHKLLGRASPGPMTALQGIDLPTK